MNPPPPRKRKQQSTDLLVNSDALKQTKKYNQTHILSYFTFKTFEVTLNSEKFFKTIPLEQEKQREGKIKEGEIKNAIKDNSCIQKEGTLKKEEENRKFKKPKAKEVAQKNKKESKEGESKENFWKVIDFYKEKMKFLKTEKFNQWIMNLKKAGQRKFISFGEETGISPNSVIKETYHEMLIEMLYTINQLFPVVRFDQINLKYGFEFESLKEIEIPDKLDNLKNTFFLTLCKNKSDIEAKRLPIFLLKIRLHPIEEEIKILKAYFEKICLENSFKLMTAIFVTEKSMTFIRYDGMNNVQKLILSQEFECDVCELNNNKKLSRGFKKSFRIMTSIISEIIEKYRVFLRC